MARVESRDGTQIVCERIGDGPSVVLVGGALDDGAENAPLAVELAGEFTVVNYARRGRGGSGNIAPYALEREIEDLAAVVEAALALFMRLAGAPEEDIAGARSSPMWPALEELAPTLAHDAACLGDGPPPASRLAAVARPALVLTGTGADPHMPGLGADFFGPAADAIAALVPGAARRTLDAPEHRVDAKILAPVLARFFTGR
ncbi:alpha/beta fold hydrolase [Sphaerisporangium aureirubrum]|uniref:Alpha/beta fold hydrolase n=1 Tax=Sphaerisporangium aureirubrum TaxID=1544736 RepID=A0ABW1NAU3_9ACTN